MVYKRFCSQNQNSFPLWQKFSPLFRYAKERKPKSHGTGRYQLHAIICYRCYVTHLEIPQLKNGLVVLNTVHTCHCRQFLLERADKPRAGSTLQGRERRYLASVFSDQASVMQRQGNRELKCFEREVSWGRKAVPFIQNHHCSWRCKQVLCRVLVGGKH